MVRGGRHVDVGTSFTEDSEETRVVKRLKIDPLEPVETGYKRVLLTKLSKTTSEVVETKTETDHAVQSYIACNASTQTSSEDDDDASPSPPTPSHSRTTTSHLLQAVFPSLDLSDPSFASLTETIIDDVELDSFVNELVEASESGQDAEHPLAELLNYVLDFAARNEDGDYEAVIPLQFTAQNTGDEEDRSLCVGVSSTSVNPERSLNATIWDDVLVVTHIEDSWVSSHQQAREPTEEQQVLNMVDPDQSFSSHQVSFDPKYPPSRSSPPSLTAAGSALKRPRSYVPGISQLEPPSKRQRLSNHSTSQKNTSSSDALKPSHILPIRHGSPPPPPTPLAQSALRTFSAQGNRRHVLGLSLHESGRSTRIWYFDRAGTICSDPIQIGSEDFVRWALCLRYATPKEMGFEPCIVGIDDDEGEGEVGEVVRRSVDVQGRTYVIDEVLSVTPCLYGRGTSLYSAHLLSSSLDDGGPQPQDHNEDEEDSRPFASADEQVLLKLSWYPSSWPSNTDAYTAAREAGVEGVVHLYASQAISRLSAANGVRARLGREENAYRDRELRAQVFGPVCVPLCETLVLARDEVREWKRAVASLLRAHRDLYVIARVLHRDIGLHSLMVDVSDHSKGILIDLDIAQCLPSPLSSPSTASRSPLPRGTPVFRAIDLCTDDVRATSDPAANSKHLYRHDLESFFYTLVWMMVHHARLPGPDDDTSSLESASEAESDSVAMAGPELESLLAKWHPTQSNPDPWSSARAAKLAFLCASSPPWSSSSPPRSNKHMQDIWEVLDGVRKMFGDGYRARERRGEVGGDKEWDEETLGGHVAFERFVEILERGS